MRGWIATQRQMLQYRLLVLRQFGNARPSLVALGVVLLSLWSLVPAAAALAAGVLVDQLAADPTGANVVTAPIPLILVLLSGRIVDHLVDPVRFAVIHQVERAHRRAVAEAAGAPARSSEPDAAEFQDGLRRASAGDSGMGNTPGVAAWAQLSLTFRYLAVTLAAAIIARDVPWLAVVLLAVLLAGAVGQRREFLRPVRAVEEGVPHWRRADYWRSVLTEPATAKELRVFGLDRWAGDRYLEATEAALSPFHAARASKLRRQWIFLLMVIPAIAGSFCALGLLAAAGDISSGHLAGDLVAVGSMLTVVSLGGENHPMRAVPSLLALERIRRPRPTPAPGAAQPPSGTPLVRFEGVTFGYPGSAEPALSGIDFEIRPGERVVLLGLDGAGKTAIVKLIAGLLQPDAGRITVDGVDLSDLAPVAWRRRITVVFQDFVRYPLSARENVALDHADRMSDSDLRAVAQDAGITDLVDGLPHGWDTPLAPGRTGGADLSRGQWRRIALARAICAMRAGARVLVVDELTSHVDVQTGPDALDRLADAARDASVLLLSHRIPTARTADRILLIADGTIAESGTHDELMEHAGAYAAMFRLQSQGLAEDTDAMVEEVAR